MAQPMRQNDQYQGNYKMLFNEQHHQAVVIMVAVVSSSVWMHPKTQGTHGMTSSRSAHVQCVHANVLVFIVQMTSKRLCLVLRK
jgi:hypothetical protein